MVLLRRKKCGFKRAIAATREVLPTATTGWWISGGPASEEEEPLVAASKEV